MDEEAVSPVIGVILMVAITVVLGAVVFVIVTQSADDVPGESATMTGQKDEGADRWQIIAGSDVAQSRFSFMADQAGARYAWNQTATASSPLLTTTAIQMQGDDPWAAGAYLSVCAASAPLSNLEITFVDRANNSVATSTTFALVAVCA